MVPFDSSDPESGVRAFRWHDLPFAYRMAGTGTSLDTQLGLTVGDDNLHHALLTGTGRTQIYVLREREQEAMGVVHFLPESQQSRLAYLAPSLNALPHENLWLKLLDGLTRMAGRRGVINMIAEIDESAPELEVLRESNFGVYSRQFIWERPAGPLDLDDELDPVLQPMTTIDEGSALALYSMLVPRLMQQVEPPPTSADTVYVLRGDMQVEGVLAVYRGPHRTLFDVYLHPRTYRAAPNMIRHALELLRADSRPICCRVRSYMDWVSPTLADLGFEYLTEQAVMVRHLAARIGKYAFSSVGLAENVSLLTKLTISTLERDETTAYWNVN
ncbi:MAG: hypothetical protein GYB68_02875 [Chloroflexi bacterium]|nr:hypothetical protein [Chloroflexota bacterium]